MLTLYMSNYFFNISKPYIKLTINLGWMHHAWASTWAKNSNRKLLIYSLHLHLFCYLLIYGPNYLGLNTVSSFGDKWCGQALVLLYPRSIKVVKSCNTKKKRKYHLLLQYVKWKIIFLLNKKILTIFLGHS